MAKQSATEALPWERQPGEGTKAYEAFSTYRDMGYDRSIAKVAEKLGKSEALLERWSRTYKWVERVTAWDVEADRLATKKLLKDIANTRARQRKQALKMQVKGLELLKEIQPGDAKLSEIVSLLKLGMEQERITLGDVGEVVEERNGGDAVSAVQIYIPDNGRGRDQDNFDDLEV